MSVPSSDQSEHCVEPDLLLVHDPTEFGALDHLPTDSGQLLQDFLFRDRPDIERFREQHSQLVDALRRHAKVVYLSELLNASEFSGTAYSLRANPNHVYTHDSMITIPWIANGYIPGNMTKDVRRAEPAVLADVAGRLGLTEITRLPPQLYLEGGDVMPFCYAGKRALLIGYGPRTSQESLVYLRDALMQDDLIDEIIGFALAPWRLNLDGCFFPVTDSLAVCHRDSILTGVQLGPDSRRDIKPIEFFEELGFTIVDATREESYMNQACNFVCLGRKTLVAYGMTDRINSVLRGHGLNVISVDGSELVKGNGGPHCMTRPVYGNGRTS